MAICIHTQTKQIVSLDTVTATASGQYVVYHKRPLPADLAATPPKYWVLDGDQFRVATAAERKTIDAAETELARAAAVQQIKEQARADILDRFPEWRQANMTARAVELLERKTDQQLTDAERTEIDAIRAAWQWIKDRRAQSDAEEAALLAARVDALIDPA